MAFKEFKQFVDGSIHLDVGRIVGIGSCFEQGHVKIWVEGRREPFEVVGEAEAVRREVERARRDEQALATTDGHGLGPLR
jgi:hypothetical protein